MKKVTYTEFVNEIQSIAPGFSAKMLEDKCTESIENMYMYLGGEIIKETNPETGEEHNDVFKISKLAKTDFLVLAYLVAHPDEKTDIQFRMMHPDVPMDVDYMKENDLDGLVCWIDAAEIMNRRQLH